MRRFILFGNHGRDIGFEEAYANAENDETKREDTKGSVGVPDDRRQGCNNEDDMTQCCDYAPSVSVG